ncbi:MAG: hypothetical protein WKF61_01560, partial [Luteimonas sp.]
ELAAKAAPTESEGESSGVAHPEPPRTYLNLGSNELLYSSFPRRRESGDFKTLKTKSLDSRFSRE